MMRMTRSILLFNGIVFLSYAQAVLVPKPNKNSRGCFAELRCGGKNKSLNEFQLIEMFLIEKSENLSIAVQGLPGLRGPQGPTGTVFMR